MGFAWRFHRGDGVGMRGTGGHRRSDRAEWVMRETETAGDFAVSGQFPAQTDGDGFAGDGQRRSLAGHGGALAVLGDRAVGWGFKRPTYERVGLPQCGQSLTSTPVRRKIRSAVVSS